MINNKIFTDQKNVKYKIFFNTTKDRGPVKFDGTYVIRGGQRTEDRGGV